jgi:hypothetical protein
VGERSRSFVVPLAVLLVLSLGGFSLRMHSRAQATATAGRTVGQVSVQERAATFTFDPGVPAADRNAFLSAVADARPEAQALIAAIDGLVDVHIGVTEAGTVGTTQSVGDRFNVMVNLGMVSQRYGQRGIDRDVLHELGHVIDFALVGPELNAQLDATIPRGYGCDRGTSGSCASDLERFAESFAKWATGDIGVDLYLGYKIPPPDDLARWGAPLAKLAGAGA